jgi:KaiC/GvpD/RAD55 family RecA-like ATPase
MKKSPKHSKVSKKQKKSIKPKHISKKVNKKVNKKVVKVKVKKSIKKPVKTKAVNKKQVAKKSESGFFSKLFGLDEKKQSSKQVVKKKSISKKIHKSKSKPSSKKLDKSKQIKLAREKKMKLRLDKIKLKKKIQEQKKLAIEKAKKDKQRQILLKKQKILQAQKSKHEAIEKEKAAKIKIKLDAENLKKVINKKELAVDMKLQKKADLDSEKEKAANIKSNLNVKKEKLDSESDEISSVNELNKNKSIKEPVAKKETNEKCDNVDSWDKKKIQSNGNKKLKSNQIPKESYMKTYISGFDALVNPGIPEGAALLVEGGPGSGKTIFCLELAKNMCERGKKVLYMSFEEPEYRLKRHMNSFGANVDKYEKQGLLYIKRFNALDIARSVEALLSEAKKELLIDVQPVLIPKDFEPDIVLVDSLTSIGSAFSGEDSRFRIYMEQLFRYLESHDITSFLIRETSSPTHIGQNFVEKAEAVSFLSDGIIALYNVYMASGKRKRALEVVKMRGTHIERKIVECDIVGKKGIVIYPDRLLKGKYKLT